jgi:8-oxo-dGTP pyrophosphatase MutT (NUDIX family)
MISIDIASHRFQLRAAAIVRRGEEVLLHRAERDPFWALPGGRVEAGEAAPQAVVRELREELGVEASCGELLIVVENFFDYDGRAYHELGLCFETRLAPGSGLLEARGPVLGREGDATLIFEWFDRARLRAADVRPAFLAGALADPAPGLRHVVHRDRATIAP